MMKFNIALYFYEQMNDFILNDEEENENVSKVEMK